MNDKDTELLQEAMKDIYGTKGAYTIQVQLVDAKGNVVDKMSHEISGDEAAYHSYQMVHKVLAKEEDEDDTYYSASSQIS